MADELIDITDISGNVLSQEMKSIAHRDGLWHRAIHVWICNLNNEVLLQLRSKDKALYPDVWDVSCAGHIGAGEDVVTGALREIEEELGLKLTESDLKLQYEMPVDIHFRDIHNCEIISVFLLRKIYKILRFKKKN